MNSVDTRKLGPLSASGSRAARQARAATWPQARRRWLAILGLAVFIFTFQGTRSLWEPDEGRYTAVAVEMLRTGNFLVPHLHPEHPHYTKPPATYWAIAGGLRLVGYNAWGARLPYGLAFLGTILLVGMMARRLAPGRGWMPPLIYATMLLPFAAANVVSTDTLLCFAEALAVAMFVEAWWGEPSRRRRWLFWMWAGFGLAFLVKGPPGLLPLLAIFAFAALVESLGAARRLVTLPGMVAFALLAFGWYGLLIAHDPALLHYFIFDEFLGRIATGMHHRNPEWYGWIVVYVPTLLLGTFPWILLLARKPRPRWGLLRTWLGREARRESRETLFLVLWFVLPLIVFCVARSRLVLYVLPLCVPAALLLARRLPPGYRPGRGLAVALVIWMVALVGIKGAGALKVDTEKTDLPVAEAIRAQVPFHPTELVFVECDPFYGLTMYLRSQVEVCTFEPPKPDEADYVLDDDMAEELAESEHKRLFIIEEKDTDDLERVLNTSGRRARVVGGYDNLRFYALDSDT